MTVDRKMTGRALSIPAGLAIGALVSMLITILISAISAHLISAEVMGQDWIGYCAVAALLAGALEGAATAAARVKHQYLIICLLNGITFYCVLLCLTALLFGGQYEGMGVTLFVVMTGSAVAALLMNRQPKRTSTHRRKKTYR